MGGRIAPHECAASWHGARIIAFDVRAIDRGLVKIKLAAADVEVWQRRRHQRGDPSSKDS